jgi:hypothetical protein
VHRKIREGSKKGVKRTAASGEELRLRVAQPDLADHFRWAKASLDQAAKDIAELRRRAGQLGRRSG